MARDQALTELARAYGIQVEYEDAGGETRRSSNESVVAVLQALGAELDSAAGARSALRARVQAHWSAPGEPVVAGIAGEGACVPIRAAASASGRLHASLRLEGGEARTFAAELGTLSVAASARVEGRSMCERQLELPADLPPGYHELTLERNGKVWRTLVIVAPPSAPSPAKARQWGVFLPLYALHTEATRGIADVADLERLRAFVTGSGGDLVGTTPLFAAFEGAISPYEPASRLFWNEIYADIRASPELARSPAAQELLSSRAFLEGAQGLADRREVDYRAALGLRRPILEALAATLFDSPKRRAALEARLRIAPDLGEYARFRATCEILDASWPEWPRAAREGTLSVADDHPAFRYYAYAQWLVDEQLVALAQRPGAGLYLDQPIGVHAESYDTWRYRGSFALAASGGAPPDLFFTEGQSWGFPPLHPDGIRDDRHRYTIACIRRIASHARSIRVDHVMGLHRLYWVPRGFPAKEGAYVSYPVEELYAILCLEADRCGTTVVGEDLGTVPAEVRATMERRGVRRSYVLQFSIDAESGEIVEPPPVAGLASANTHDMPPFAAYWRDAEPTLRAAVLHYLDEQGITPPNGSAEGILRALLDDLAAGDVETVMVTLEDLWGETEPQNVPGTSGEDAHNWRRRARHSLEQMASLPQVAATMRGVDRNRRKPAERGAR